MKSITYLKEKLKNLEHLLHLPRLAGLAATVAFTFIYHLGSIYFGYTASIMALVCIMLISAFVGGLRVALACAAWIGVYAWFIIPNDPTRLAQLWLGLFAIAGIVGWQTRRLRAYYAAADQMFNGNAAKLKDGLAFLRRAKDELREVEDLITRGEDKLGNVLAGVVGYQQLRQTISEVEDWYADPANMKKMADWEKDKDAD